MPLTDHCILPHPTLRTFRSWRKQGMQKRTMFVVTSEPSVIVDFFNHAVSWSWHAHDQPWGELKPHVHFSPIFVASSDLRWGFSSPTEHNLCGIQTCSATHVAYMRMFSGLRPNRLASTLGRVIRFDLASTLSQPTRSCHQEWTHMSFIILGHPNIHPSIHLGFIEALDLPVSMLYRLRIPYRIIGVWSNLWHIGWGTMSTHSCRPTLFLKIHFKGSHLTHLSHNARPHCDARMCHMVVRLGHRA